MVLPPYISAEVIARVPGARFSKLADTVLLNLLLNEDEKFRRSASKKIAGTLPAKRVRQILAAYRAHEEGGYYSVTHWLDLPLALPQTAVAAVLSKAG